MGVVERLTPLGDDGEQADASEYAENTRSTFNSNASAITNWTNSRANASTSYDVVRVRFTDESGNKVWMFIVSDVNTTTGEYTNAKMLNLTDFQKRNREYDQTYTLEPYASRNANMELERFVSEYAKPDKNVSKSYLAHIAGKYGGQVSGSDLPDKGNQSSSSVRDWFLTTSLTGRTV